MINKHRLEKVIKGLELCIQDIGLYACQKCPYKENCKDAPMQKDALSVIREQQEEIQRLQRKSRWIVNTKKYGEDNYHCLLCGAIVEKDEAGRHYWQRCYHCGAYMELMDGTDRDYDKDGEQKC